MGERIPWTRVSERLGDGRSGGVDVRGRFSWTGIDNDEWLGADTVPFGRFDRDRNPRPPIAAVRPAEAG